MLSELGRLLGCNRMNAAQLSLLLRLRANLLPLAEESREPIASRQTNVLEIKIGARPQGAEPACRTP